MLTAQTIKAAKPQDSRYWLNDKGSPLVVLVEASGRKTYQAKFKAKSATIRRSIGTFPDMSLADARLEAMKLKKAVSEGSHEGSQRRLKGLTTAAPEPEPETTGLTFSDAYARYLDSPSVKKLAQSTQDEKLAMLETIFEPAGLGTKPLLAITRHDIEQLIAEKHAALLARSGNGNRIIKILANLKAFFEWCCRKGHAITGLDENPPRYVEADAEYQPRTRYLSDKELVLWFRANATVNRAARIEGREEIDFARYFEVLLRTGARRSDILDAEWGWLEGDKLLVPTTKNGEASLVSLAGTPLKLIGVRPNDAKDSDRIFATINMESLKRPVDRLREEMERLAGKEGIKFEDFRPHDYRRSMLHYLHSQGVPEDITERMIAHTESRTKSAGIKRVYNVFKYRDEKSEAWKLWNAHLDTLKAKAAKGRG